MLIRNLLKITGTETIDQLLNSLKAYKSSPTWCFECICKLFHSSLPMLDKSTMKIYCESIKVKLK